VKRNTVNFIIDTACFLVLAVLAVTGFVIKYILPPGTSGRGQALHDGLGREYIKTLSGLSRHQWGDIHFYLAVVFVILIVIHIILHWNWIKKYALSMLGSK